MKKFFLSLCVISLLSAPSVGAFEIHPVGAVKSVVSAGVSLVQNTVAKAAEAAKTVRTAVLTTLSTALGGMLQTVDTAIETTADAATSIVGGK